MASSSTEMAIFQRVAERGSFAGAAEDVGLSPSAVAKLITRLEQRLGVRLINRTTRRLALTAEGEIYLDRAREIIGAIEAAESEIASARVSPQGHLRVPRQRRAQAHLLRLIAGGIVGSMPLSRTRQSTADLFRAANAPEPCDIPTRLEP